MPLTLMLLRSISLPSQIRLLLAILSAQRFSENLFWRCGNPSRWHAPRANLFAVAVNPVSQANLTHGRGKRRRDYFAAPSAARGCNRPSRGHVHLSRPTSVRGSRRKERSQLPVATTIRRIRSIDQDERVRRLLRPGASAKYYRSALIPMQPAFA